VIKNFHSHQSNSDSFQFQLTKLGAKSFYKLGIADEVHGLEEQVEVWLSGLWEALESISQQQEEPKQLLEGTQPEKQEVKPAKPPAKKKIAVKIKAVPDVPSITVGLVKSDASVEIHPLYGPKRNPEAQLVSITQSRWLTSVEAKKQTVEVTFQLPEEFPSYVPGDSIGIYCPNTLDLVNSVLAHLEIDGDVIYELSPNTDSKLVPSHIQALLPNSIRTILTWGVDLQDVPKKTTLRMLAEYCSNQSEKETLIHLSSIKGKSDFATIIEANRPSLAELFHLYPSCKPPIDHLLSVLGPLVPRYYSFCSSPLVGGKKARVAFSLVEILTAHNQLKHGLCTHWLTKLCIQHQLLEPGHYSALIPVIDHPEDALQVWAIYNRSSHFHIPSPIDSPLVMIGPGTGVAPFIGFLEHIQASYSEGQYPESWLFFGCRHPDHDYLYKDNLTEYAKQNVLKQLVTAFSRETSKVVYVQHKLLEYTEELADLIVNQNATVFICGDAKGMSKDVSAALQTILQTRLPNSKAAMEQFAKLTKAGKIVFDVWF